MKTSAAVDTRRHDRPHRRAAARRLSRVARASPAAAAAEFAARGFAGANVDRIARAARVNKAMIYYHFKSKAALYREILRDMFGGRRGRASPRRGRLRRRPRGQDPRLHRGDRHRGRGAAALPADLVPRDRRGRPRTSTPTTLGYIAATCSRRSAPSSPKGVAARRFQPVNPLLRPRRHHRAAAVVLRERRRCAQRLARARRDGADRLESRATVVAHVQRVALASLGRADCMRLTGRRRVAVVVLVGLVPASPLPVSIDGRRGRSAAIRLRRGHRSAGRRRGRRTRARGDGRRRRSRRGRRRRSRGSTPRTPSWRCGAPTPSASRRDAQLRLLQRRRRGRRHPPGARAGASRRRPTCRRPRRSSTRAAADVAALRDAAPRQRRLAQAARRCGDAAGRGGGAGRGGAGAGAGRGRRRSRGSGPAPGRRRSTARGRASPPSTRRSPRFRRTSPTPWSRRRSPASSREAGRRRRNGRAARAASSSSPISITPGRTCTSTSRSCRGCKIGQAATLDHRRRAAARRDDHLHLAEGRVHAAQRADGGGAVEARLPGQGDRRQPRRRAEAGHAGRSGAARSSARPR